MLETILKNEILLNVISDYEMEIIAIKGDIIYLCDLQEDKINEWDINSLLDFFIDQYKNKLNWYDSEYLQEILDELLMLRKNLTTI